MRHVLTLRCFSLYATSEAKYLGEAAMTASKLIKHHQSELEKWSNQADETGLFVARDTWDAIEREVEDYTADGVTWDFIEDMPYSWALQLGMAFDEACEKWIEQRLHELDNLMSEALGERWCYDINRTMLDNLRQGVRVGNQYESYFAKLIRQARPGVLEVVRRAWINDEDYVLNHMDNDSLKDGLSIRQQFYEARHHVAPQLASLATEMLRRSIRLYQTALAGVEGALQVAGCTAK